MPQHMAKFGDLVRSLSTRGHQTDTLRYAPSGRFPVVDQGTALVAGFSDDETKVLAPGPVVVFGDHTRTVKYVDFPFVVGADGTKILQPLDPNLSVRFLSYLTEYAALKVPNLGYSRHFKELKDVAVRVPSRSCRDRVVDVLETWDRGIEVGSALVAARYRALQVARRALVENAEADVAEVSAFAANTNRLISVQEAARRAFPCIELENMEERTGRLLGTADTSQLRGARRAFEPGDVLYGRLRPYLRKFAHAQTPGVCSTEVWVLGANPSVCLPGYLYQIVQTDRFNTEANKSSGSRMPRADWDVLSRVKFPLPSIEQQRRVVALLAAEEQALDLLTRLVKRLGQQRAGLLGRLLSGVAGLAPGGTARKIAEPAHA